MFSCLMEEHPHCPLGLLLAAPVITPSLSPVTQSCCFPGATAKDSSRRWPFQCWSLLTSTLSCWALAFVLLLRSDVSCDSPVVSAMASMWLCEGEGHVNHHVRTGLPAFPMVPRTSLIDLTRSANQNHRQG